MKILIISTSFYPINSPRSFRTTELAIELSKRKHEVTVITEVNPEQEALAARHGLTIKPLGIKTVTTLKTTKTRNRVIKRVLRQFFNWPDIEYRNIVYESLKQEENNYDVLISIAAPHAVHWGVSKFISKMGNNNKKWNTWIADCGDPFMLSENANYKKPFYFSYLEKSFCRKADFITVPIENAKKAYYSEFLNKIKVIPQGFRFDSTNKGASPENKVTTFAYAGSLMLNRRDPSQLIEYLVEREYEFKFFIYSDNRKILEKYLNLYPEKILYKSKIPRNKLLSELSDADFLVNFRNVGESQSPSKLIDYAISGRPVISLDCNNIDEKKIDKFMKKNYSTAEVIQNIEQYRIENVVDRFEKLF